MSLRLVRGVQDEEPWLPNSFRSESTAGTSPRGASCKTRQRLEVETRRPCFGELESAHSKAAAALERAPERGIQNPQSTVGGVTMNRAGRRDVVSLSVSLCAQSRRVSSMNRPQGVTLPCGSIGRGRGSRGLVSPAFCPSCAVFETERRRNGIKSSESETRIESRAHEMSALIRSSVVSTGGSRGDRDHSRRVQAVVLAPLHLAPAGVAPLARSHRAGSAHRANQAREV